MLNDSVENFIGEFLLREWRIAAGFLRNAANRRYLSTKYLHYRDFFPATRRYRRKVSAIISTRDLFFFSLLSKKMVIQQFFPNIRLVDVLVFLTSLLVKKVNLNMLLEMAVHALTFKVYSY